MYHGEVQAGAAASGENGRRMVELDVASVNSSGEEKVVGTAVAAIPVS